MKLGERIRELRKQANFTQPELAEKIGVHETTVRRWEQDKDKGPGFDMIQKLAQALGTTAGDLMGETDTAGAHEEKTPDEKNNLPINNTPRASEDDLDLGYWGAMAERAARVAQSENEGKKKIISAILKQAAEAVTGAGSEGGKNEVNQVIYGGRENKNEFNA